MEDSPIVHAVKSTAPEQLVNQTLTIINERRVIRGEPPLATLKPKQIECISAAGKGNDLLGIMPTGYGKSLLFEAIPIYRGLQDGSSMKKTIVISPLNAIIDQQLTTLAPDAIRMARSDCNAEDLDDNFHHDDSDTEENDDIFAKGSFKYLVGHPEDFLSKMAMTVMKKAKWRKEVSTIFVDEAHVVVQWGQGFREKYREIENLRAIFPEAQFVALTATASLKMRAEIKRVLNLKALTTVTAEIDRINIFYAAKRRPSSTRAVEESYTSVFVPLMQELKVKRMKFPKTIIYTTLKWCGFGNEVGVKVLADGEVSLAGVPEVAQFHAPLSAEVKKGISLDMNSNDSSLRLLLATEAFGMGVDTPDIRRIVHAGPPCTLETYVQTTGRGGRDGLQCHACLYFNNEDLGKDTLDKDMRDLVTTTSCRRSYICAHFGTEKAFRGKKHDCCDNCANVCDCAECVHDVQLCSALARSEIDAPLNPDPHSPLIAKALLKVFRSVNHKTANPMDPQLFTGLTQSIAIDIGNNYSQFVGASDLLRVNYFHLIPEYINLIHAVIKGYLEMVKARLRLGKIKV